MVLQGLLLSLSLQSPLLTPTTSHVAAQDLGTAWRPITQASNDLPFQKQDVLDANQICIFTNRTYSQGNKPEK